MSLFDIILSSMKCIYKKERKDLSPGEMKHQSAEKASVRELRFKDKTILFSEVDTLLPMDPF